MACDNTKEREHLNSFPSGTVILKLEVIQKGIDEIGVKK